MSSSLTKSWRVMQPEDKRYIYISHTHTLTSLRLPLMMSDSCKCLANCKSSSWLGFTECCQTLEHGFTVFLFSCSWYPCKAMQGFRSNNILIKSDPEGGVGELAHTCASPFIGALDRADVWWWKPDNRGHARINIARWISWSRPWPR